VSEAFEIVRAGYDRIGESYRTQSNANPVRLRWVRHLLTLLTPGSIVVELGCGPGEPATRLIAEAHRVIGVDGSASQLALACEVVPSGLLIQADMTRFAMRPASVDAVASFYALGHVPSRQHAELFRSIAEWLRPGGVLLTSAPVGRGDGIDPSWFGVPMFFGAIGDDATRLALRDAGLRLDTLERVEEDEGTGEPVSFMWLVARKTAVT
jgi:SAM-dependent methyltransferase